MLDNTTDIVINGEVFEDIEAYEAHMKFRREAEEARIRNDRRLAAKRAKYGYLPTFFETEFD